MGDREPGDVSALGTIECAYGAPLTVAIYRGMVNIAGRMLTEDQAEQFAVLFTAACWQAGRDHARTGGGSDA